MDSWKASTLRNHVELVTGNPFASKDYSSDTDDIKLLRGDNISQGSLRWDDVKRWPKSKLVEYKKFELEAGDIVLAMDRPWIGAGLKYASLSYDDLPCLLLQRTARLRGGKDLDTGYLKYIIGSPWFSRYIQRITTGSVVPHISGNQIKDFPVLLPPIDEQKNIAKVLSSFDKKIELNNKINTELEAMAKLIYDYWFVQFDFPDENGKPYKSSDGKMIYSPELNREIPDGWIGTRIGHILNTELGGTPSTKIKEYWIGDIPWLNSGEIANFPIIESEEQITGSAINNSAASLMPKGTCVLSITRHLRPSILAVDACANQSVVGIFENKKLKSSFLYPYLKSQIKRLMSLRTGAQQPHINKGIVDDSPIILPPEDVLNSYYEKVDDIYEKINNTAFQNKELTQLRDWLLPMLMNGQVTVR